VFRRAVSDKESELRHAIRRGSNQQSELRFVPPSNDFKDEKQKITRVPERHNGNRVSLQIKQSLRPARDPQVSRQLE
jgi:hypothetical protein